MNQFTTSSNQPGVKKSHIATVNYDMLDTAFDPTMTYVDVNTQTPWTTSEKSWRAASAPQLWPQELRAALKLGGDSEDEEDVFAGERGTLTHMRKSMNKINKFYIPISKLPPLGGLDPRRRLAERPPSCAPDCSVPRAHRIVQRWQSMPRLRSQLPEESLLVIEAAMKRDKPASVRWLDQQKRRLEKPGIQNSKRNSGRGQKQLSSRQDTDARLASVYLEGEGSARKEHPHIPCSCCDHRAGSKGEVEKSRRHLKAPGNPRASGSKSPGRKVSGHGVCGVCAAPGSDPRARGSSPDASGSSRSRTPDPARPRSTVSFEDPRRAGCDFINCEDASSQCSSAKSEDWHG